MRLTLLFSNFFYLLIINPGLAQLQPVSLPLYENFEKASGQYVNSTSCVYCDSNISFAYENNYITELTFNEGISSSFTNPSDTGAATMKGGSFSYPDHSLTATIDMSNYDTSDAGDVLFSFNHFDHYDEQDTGDAIEVRGSQNDPWLEFYDLTEPHLRTKWVAVQNLNVTAILEANGQNFSSAFQIKVKHSDTQSNLGLDGRSFDEFLLEYSICPPPRKPEVYISTSGVTLRWEKASLADSTEVIFGPPGFFNGGSFSGSGLVTVSDSLFLDTLQPNQNFDFWLRHKCSTFSNWVGPIRGHTMIQAPYFQSFDKAKAIPLRIRDSTIRFGEWKIINDLSRRILDSSSSIYQFALDSEYSSTGPGPLVHAGYGSGSFIVANVTNGIESSIAAIIPPINISTITNPELRFSHHIGGIANASINLVVEVDTGNGWHQFYTVTGQRQTNITMAWTDEVLSLANYPDIIKVRFRSESVQTASYVAIDEIAIDNPVTCAKPYALRMFNNTTNSADFMFNSANPGNLNYQISYGPGLQSTANGTMQMVSGNTFSINNLSPGTQYCVYIREICGVADTSYWSDQYCFTTQCLPITAPYMNNFDSIAGPDLPICWSSTKENNVTGVVDSTDVGKLPPSGPNMLEINDAPPHVIVASPPFSDLDSGQNQVRFKMAYELSTPPIGNDSLFIGVMSNPYDITTFKTITHLKTQAPHDVFREYIVMLDDTALIGNKNYIAFRYGRAAKGLYEYYIDDFFYEAVPCPAPDSLYITNRACEEVTLNWSSNTGSSVIEYGPTGFSHGSGSRVSSQSNQKSIHGLLNQDYDFYLRDICQGDTGLAVGPITAKPDFSSKPVANFKVVQDSILSTTGERQITVDASSSIDADSYEWTFRQFMNANGQRVNQKFPDTAYPIDIELEVENNCGLKDTLSIMYNPLSNDFYKKEAQPIIYPNPTRAIVAVELPQNRIHYKSLEIFNQQGQLLDRMQIDPNTVEMYVQMPEPAGVYILRISKENDRSRYYRIVKH